VRFEVIVSVTMKIAVYYDNSRCNLVHIYVNLGGICCPHNKARSYPEDRGSSSSETSVKIFKITRRIILEDCNLHGIVYLS
jgi:hypothetical protein